MGIKLKITEEDYEKTVKGAIGIIAAAGLVAGGYFGYGVLGTKAGKVVNEVQSKVKQTVNSKDKKGQKIIQRI